MKQNMGERNSTICRYDRLFTRGSPPCYSQNQGGSRMLIVVSHSRNKVHISTTLDTDQKLCLLSLPTRRKITILSSSSPTLCFWADIAWLELYGLMQTKPELWTSWGQWKEEIRAGNSWITCSRVTNVSPQNNVPNKPLWFNLKMPWAFVHCNISSFLTPLANFHYYCMIEVMGTTGI